MTTLTILELAKIALALYVQIRAAAAAGGATDEQLAELDAKLTIALEARISEQG